MRGNRMAPSESSDKAGIVTHVVVAHDSPWFSGHFPGNPILPGIALLGFVQDAIEKYGRMRGRTFTIKRLRRVKFTRLVRPNEHLMILLSPPLETDSAEFSFEVQVEDDVCCSGYLVLAHGTDKRACA